jgi:hypothetical protein
VIAIKVAGRASRRRTQRALLESKYWILGLTAAAWVVLALLASRAHVHRHVAGGAHVARVGDLSTFTAHWLLMVVAMMWPLSIPHVDVTRVQVRRDWRLRAAAAVLLGSTLVWLALGIVGFAAYGILVYALPRIGHVAWLVGWLNIAAILTRSHRRNMLLRSCGKSTPIRIAGLGCVTSAFKAGVRTCLPCVALCGAAMAAMVAPHPLWLLVALSLVTWREQARPKKWLDPAPPLVIGAAALTIAVFGPGT